jgi:hypothetical protein
MRGRKLCGMTLVAVVGLCLGASNAAAASKLTLEANGAVLPVGAPIEAVNTTPWEIRSERGTVTCGYSTMDGTVSNNSKGKPMIELASNTVEGELGNPICGSTFAPPLDEAVVAREGTVPWTMKFIKKNTLASVAQKLEWKVKPPEPPKSPHPAIGCKFGYSTIKGTFPTNGEPLDVAFNSPLGSKANSAAQCNTSHPVLVVTFRFTSNGFPVSAVYR